MYVFDICIYVIYVCIYIHTTTSFCLMLNREFYYLGELHYCSSLSSRDSDERFTKRQQVIVKHYISTFLIININIAINY